MLGSRVLQVFATVIALSAAPLVDALGSRCGRKTITGGTKPSSAPSWLSAIPSQGTAPFSPSPSTYKVRRSVKDYGAKGDGETDDTAAINAAISDQGRCGSGCGGTTLTPLLLYVPSVRVFVNRPLQPLTLPQGTYVISSPILLLYYTVLAGNPANPSTIIASSNFTGGALIGKCCQPTHHFNGAHLLHKMVIQSALGSEYLLHRLIDCDSYYYSSTNNFYRSIRDVVVDTRNIPVASVINAIHWCASLPSACSCSDSFVRQVSQATSIYNVRIEMPRDASTGHVGIWMEDGSGGRRCGFRACF